MDWALLSVLSVMGFTGVTVVQKRALDRYVNGAATFNAVASMMQLAMAATSIKELLSWKQAVDIEWLFEGHVLYIVQARPYVGP